MPNKKGYSNLTKLIIILLKILENISSYAIVEFHITVHLYATQREKNYLIAQPISEEWPIIVAAQHLIS